MEILLSYQNTPSLLIQVTPQERVDLLFPKTYKDVTLLRILYFIAQETIRIPIHDKIPTDKNPKLQYLHNYIISQKVSDIKGTKLSSEISHARTDLTS